MPDFHVVQIGDTEFIRGAARLLWAGTTIAFPSKLGDVVNLSTYAAMAGWNDLGATKTGIAITVNNTEESFDVDQIYSDIDSQPTSWEVAVATSLAEANLDRMQLAWEGSAVTSATEDGITTRTLGIGAPQTYTRRRLAVMFQRPSGKVRGYLFRLVQRSPQESTITHAKTGEQQSIPVRFRGFADLSIADPRARFFVIKDQQ